MDSIDQTGFLKEPYESLVSMNNAGSVYNE